MVDRRGFAILLASPLMVLGCMDSVYGVDDLSYVDGIMCDDGRFVVLELGTEDCRDGSGLVVDGSTALTWMRSPFGPLPHTGASSFCASKGMRLPKKEEAVGIAGQRDCPFVCRWSTWTSTQSGSIGFWYVYDDETIKDFEPTAEAFVLCVR